MHKKADNTSRKSDKRHDERHLTATHEEYVDLAESASEVQRREKSDKVATK